MHFIYHSCLIEFNCCNSKLNLFLLQRKQDSSRVSAPGCNQTLTLSAHINLKCKCRAPQVSAVPHVKGFELGYVFSFAEKSGIKLAITTFIITKVYTWEVTQKKAEVLQPML